MIQMIVRWLVMATCFWKWDVGRSQPFRFCNAWFDTRNHPMEGRRLARYVFLAARIVVRFKKHVCKMLRKNHHHKNHDVVSTKNHRDTWRHPRSHRRRIFVPRSPTLEVLVFRVPWFLSRGWPMLSGIQIRKLRVGRLVDAHGTGN